MQSRSQELCDKLDAFFGKGPPLVKIPMPVENDIHANGPVHKIQAKSSYHPYRPPHDRMYYQSQAPRRKVVEVILRISHFFSFSSFSSSLRCGIVCGLHCAITDTGRSPRLFRTHCVTAFSCSRAHLTPSSENKRSCL